MNRTEFKKRLQPLLNTAAQFSNIAYNWSQRPGYVLTQRDCEMLDKLRRAHDEQSRVVNESIKPRAKGGML